MQGYTENNVRATQIKFEEYETSTVYNTYNLKRRG